MRIAVLGNEAAANSYYRALNPALELGKRGHAVLYDSGALPRLHDLRGCDAVIIYRNCMTEMQHAAEVLGEQGVGVIWDNDDQMWDLHPRHSDYRRFGGLRGERVKAEMLRMVRLAHVVTTPSAWLAAQYEEAGGTVQIIENHLPNEFVRVPRRAHEGLVLGWTAALEHQIDRDMLRLTDVFQRLLEAHPQLRVTTIGIGLGMKHERYANVKVVDFPNLAQELAGLDIGIAPIVDITTNRARSNCKVKEYASVGVPWLASPIGPYRDLGERQGGRLVADGEWYEAIERLVVRERERRKLGKRAAKWAQSETVEKNIGRWEAAIGKAVERARASRG